MNSYRSSADSISRATQQMSSLAGRAIDSTEFKKRYLFIRLLLKIFSFMGMVSTGWCLYMVYGTKESFVVSIQDKEEEEDDKIVTKKKIKWNKTSTQMKVASSGIALSILGVFYSVITISRMHPVDRALVDTRASMEAAMSIPVSETVDTIGAKIKTGVEEVVVKVGEGGKGAIEEIKEENLPLLSRVGEDLKKSLKKRKSYSDQVYKKWVEKTLDSIEKDMKRLKKEGDEDGVKDLKALLRYMANDMKTKIFPPTLPKAPSSRSFGRTNEFSWIRVRV